jgi:protein arginine kinase
MENPKTLPHLKNLDLFWKGNNNSIWLATTLALHRNIEKFNFPQMLELTKKKQLAELTFGALKEHSIIQQPVECFFDSMLTLERDLLYEHFLLFEPLKDSILGQSFLFTEKGDILIKMNVQDHIEICALEQSEQLETALEKIQAIEKGLEKNIKFAFSPKFGYLTEDPTLCGTGLVVKAFLHIPALIETGEVDSFLHNSDSEGVSLTGLHGSSEEIIGDMVVITNRWTLGTTEESILSLIRTTAMAITTREKEVRGKLERSQPHDETIYDKISRMLGTLKYSYTMDTSETLRALSLAKLGIELGWLQGISIEELNRLLFDLRRAHIAAQFNWAISRPEINHERASLLRILFEKVSLVP